MKVLVKFTFFSWDNHQGGSGKFLETTTLINIDPLTTCGGVTEIVKNHIENYLLVSRPFRQFGDYTIKSMEILL